jgi:hypothetical protein
MIDINKNENLSHGHAVTSDDFSVENFLGSFAAALPWIFLVPEILVSRDVIPNRVGDSVRNLLVACVDRGAGSSPGLWPDSE